MSDFGDLVRAELQRSGYTLRAACAAMYRDPAYLSRVVNGKQAPSIALAEDLDRLLGIQRFTKALTKQAAPALDGDSIAALELARLAAASEVGAGTVDLLEQSFNDLAIAYQRTDPIELLVDVRSHLAYLSGLLGKQTTLAEHQRLLDLGGWYSLLAATLNVDLKNGKAAAAQLRTAASLAAEAGNRVIPAWALETRAWASLTAGNYPSALELSLAAQEAAPDGSSALIQATAQEGRARARLGQRKETLAVVNRVQAMATTDPTQPKHHYQYDPAKAMSYTATTLAWVGDAAAERAAREVIAAYPDEDHTRWPRRLATAKIDLALALVSKGALDEAADATLKALLSGRVVPSARWRAAEVVRVVDEAGLPAAADLREVFDGESGRLLRDGSRTVEVKTGGELPGY
ncbi:helix-turn-helix domain-containing protein [Glycomyces salinus]|uniref:helix-turn-helix domain-containing protein n=1 Tax=Glycomyces salinus TaxID=980294 RepID=UPI0018EC4B60|nr:helix-turn-helix transcriptional regulator [Glycomyces salinus]